MTTPTKRFFCFTQDNVEGPFDIIELAGLLRAKHIDSDTPLCVEGTEAWINFRDHPEHEYIGEISPQMIESHLKEKAVAEESPWSPKRLGVLVWVMAPVFLYVLYLFVRMYINYHLAHGF